MHTENTYCGSSVWSKIKSCRKFADYNLMERKGAETVRIKSTIKITRPHQPAQV